MDAYREENRWMHTGRRIGAYREENRWMHTGRRIGGCIPGGYDIDAYREENRCIPGGGTGAPAPRRAVALPSSTLAAMIRRRCGLPRSLLAL